jgi:shikimate kinase
VRSRLRPALIGLRGSGKSSVGRALAALTGATFVDLDQQLWGPGSSTPIPAGELLTRLGEAAFREVELAALRRVAQDPVAQVLATGGGLVETPGARELLANSYTCVWLRAPLAVLEGRLVADPTPRPRLVGASPGEELRLLEARRDGFYRELASLVVQTDGQDPGAIAAHIAAELAQRR